MGGVAINKKLGKRTYTWMTVGQFTNSGNILQAVLQFWEEPQDVVDYPNECITREVQWGGNNPNAQSPKFPEFDFSLEGTLEQQEQTVLDKALVYSQFPHFDKFHKTTLGELL